MPEPNECPLCHKKGNAVKLITVESLVLPNKLEELSGTDSFLFCKNPACEVIYFHPENKQCVTREQIKLPLNDEGKKIEEVICYCFKHTLSDLEVDIQETGRSSIPENIRDRCRNGEDDCLCKNPSGLCCLSNVRAITKKLKLKYGIKGESGIFERTNKEELKPKTDKGS